VTRAAAGIDPVPTAGGTGIFFEPPLLQVLLTVREVITAASVMAPALDGRQSLLQVLLAVVRPARRSAECLGCPGG
jgi:hypothetical protein